MPLFQDALCKRLLVCSLLDKIQPRVVSYEEQVTTVREHLATLLEKEEDWSKAAQTLAGIDLDSGVFVSVGQLYAACVCYRPNRCKAFSLQDPVADVLNWVHDAVKNACEGPS